MQWFYALNSRQNGPITQAELDRLAAQGTVLPETLVWREGMANWQPYSSTRTAGPLPATSAPLTDQKLCAECQQLFRSDDLIRYENVFVCGNCKPVFFQKLREGLTPGGSAAIWRSGAFLVMRKDATLPSRCVKCNADAPGKMLTRKLFWHHPALYLLILPGLLIYAIIATIVGKRAKIQIALCPTHRQARTRNLIIAWALFLSCILAFILGGMWSQGWIIASGFLALLASCVFGVIVSRVVVPKKIDTEHVWLKGVSHEFLASLSEFPSPR